MYIFKLIQVELITNKDLPVSYSLKTKGISKYKKVSTDKKQLLIQLIARQGQSIIEVSLYIKPVRKIPWHQLFYRQVHHHQS
jgi:hypothetical protein